MENNISKRRICRKTDIVKMFFSIANSIRQYGRELFWQPMPDGGAVYTFRLGNRTMTYIIQEGGEL